MLTIRDYPKTRQWEVPAAKEGKTPKAHETPQKPPTLPVDEVILQKRVKRGVKDEEHLVATYWG